MAPARVCVVGAGVVGLSSATFLQDALLQEPSSPPCSLTIVADRFLKDTTSDGAAGIFRPGLQFQGPTPDVSWKWLEDSYRYYSELLASPDAATIGVKSLSGYHFSRKYPNIVWNERLQRLQSHYRPCTAAELELHGQKYGSFSTTLLTECRRYMPYLTRRFLSRGGTIEERHLESLAELADYDLVINCSGFGAKDLVKDYAVTPIRGQVFKVRAPWIKNFYFHDYDTYIIPGFDTITLGGTRQFDSYNDEVNIHDSRGIWERCVDVVPSLKDAEVVYEWVGWRPYRGTIRVEKEVIDFGEGKMLNVVHNYGHGGYGVMSSPGTSMHAVRLAMEFLNSPKSKL